MRQETQSSKMGSVASVSPMRYQETISNYNNRGYDQIHLYNKTPCATPDMMMNFDPSPTSQYTNNQG